MKKLGMRMAGLFCLCLLFALGLPAKKVEAANVTDSTKMVTYLNNKSIVLMVDEFSKTDYTYTIKDSGGNQIASGTKAAGANKYSIAITGAAANKKYTLRFEADDSGDYIEVSYFTGKTVTSLVSKNGNSKINANWAFGDGADCSSLEFIVANEDPEAALKVYQTKAISSAAETSLALTPNSSVKAGTYTTYLVTVKDGAYGEGAACKVTYIPTPAKPTLTVKRGAECANLSWTSVKKASGYQVQYKKAGGSYSYLSKGTTKTSLKASNLTEGKTYYFRVRSYTKVGSQVEYSAYTAAKSVKIPVVAKKVKGVKFSLNSSANVIMSWKKTKHATSYQVYYRKKGASEYKSLGTTKTTRFNLKKLDMMETYELIVYAKTDEIRSKKHSSKVELSPSSPVNKNKMKKLAAKVRTIGYTKKGCIYTKKKYSKEIKEAYVNYNGYKSRTKYMIFVSLYTQQATIFTGYKKHWRQFRTFTIAGGSFENRTPRGKFKIFRKEYVWMHPDTETRYISHFYKKASFHARPMYHNGKIQAPTLGRPISNACVRCPTEQAIFIYKHIPIGTFVRSI